MTQADREMPPTQVKVRYMSDLHREFVDYTPHEIESIGEDLVVLAGDIGVGVKGVDWATTIILAGATTIILAGGEALKAA